MAHFKIVIENVTNAVAEIIISDLPGQLRHVSVQCSFRQTCLLIAIADKQLYFLDLRSKIRQIDYLWKY